MLPRKFYRRDSAEVAKDILGDVLAKNGMKGKIVETEAYYGEDDPASHASSGKTERNEKMFGKPGISYVYLCYGLYYLFNITTREKGKPGAVLIRSLKPLKGLNRMKENREINEEDEMTNGPGKLTEALNIDKKDNGTDLTDEESGIKVEEGKDVESIGKSKRIGITGGEDLKLRFYIEGSNFLSE